MNPKLFVVVHAYQDGTLTKGSVTADVTRTPEDRRFLARERLDSMIRHRDGLNREIDMLESKLESGDL